MYDYLDKLNEEQRDAATTIYGPLLIIAGAGAGKTTTLINRVAYMIDKGINPNLILLLTFTNEAAKNMIEKASKNSDEKCNLITACTYHSFCVKLLRNFGTAIDIPRNFEILSNIDAEDVFKVLKQTNSKFKIKGFPSNKKIVEISSMMINTDIHSVEEFQNMLDYHFSDYSDFREELLELFSIYRHYKKDHDLLDYDDLLLKTRTLLRNETVSNIIQDQYQYIMVDEYQDTNTLQEDIVMMLSRKYKNLAVVGDDYQSIYKFRGADINNIIHFPERIGDCKEIILDTNYRSTGEIIKVANSVMKHHAHFGYKKKMKDANSHSVKPSIDCPYNEADEALSIFNTIQDKHKKGLPYADIAILARTGKETGTLEGLLNKAGIPYVKKGGKKFFEHDAVRDMLAYLKIIVNSKNELSWSRVLDVLPGIGETYSANISKECGNTDFLIQNKYKRNIFYPRLVDFYNFYQQLLSSDQSFQELFQSCQEYYIDLRKDIIKNMNVEDEGKRTEYENILEDDIEYIETLWNMAKEYPTITAFLDDIVLEPNKQIDNTDMLTISTIHSAKGLEWDTVFVMNAVENYMPCTHENIDKETFDEDLRCFYVAITRAKKDLIIEAPDIIIAKGKHFGGLTHICEEAKKHMIVKEGNHLNTEKQTDKSYKLTASFYEKDIVKQMGATWNAVEKSWFAKKTKIQENPKLISFLYNRKEYEKDLISEERIEEDIEIDER